MIELCHLPCQPQTARHRPLAPETGLTPEDLAHVFSLALPDGVFPQLAQRLKAQLLWSTPQEHNLGAIPAPGRSQLGGRHHRRRALCCGVSGNLEQHPELTSLSWSLRHIGGGLLVIRRDRAERGAILLLQEEELRGRVQRLAQRHDERRSVG